MKNNRLKVQKIVRSVLVEGLAKIGMTGWTVQEFASPHYVSLDKCVLMNLVRFHQLGWQYDNLTGDDSTTVRKDEWLELEHWQLHIIAKRPTAADVNSIVAEDVASELIAWLNGPGMNRFRANGIAPERIDGATILVYNDDNEIYQKRAVFTVKIEVPKELITEAIEADAVKPKVMPV